jgi:hypothetical protein
VAERGLGDVQKVRRARKPTCLMDGPDRAQMAKIDVHY